MKNYKGTVARLAEKTADSLGYELVDIEYKKERDGLHVICFIYKEDGISIDDCTDFSRVLSDLLDEEDPILDGYFLEVSSPGLDRPLKNSGDYRRNLGNTVDVKLYSSLNGKKSFQGILKSYTDKIVILNVEGMDVEIPISVISMMKQTIIF